MAIGAPQLMTYTGMVPTFGAAAALDFVTPDAQRFLWVKNGGGVSTSVGVTVPGSTVEQPNPDIAVSIPAGQERLIGPLVSELGEPSLSNSVVVQVSPTASVTVAAVDFPPPEPPLPT